MSCDVYANGDEIACKAGGGKVIAAFPDVCLTPPPPPGGPIPVPYPDTSFSKDMKKGSKTVKIENKEIMLKIAPSIKPHRWAMKLPQEARVPVSSLTSSPARPILSHGQWMFFSKART